jgi:WbqC-like protein family
MIVAIHQPNFLPWLGYFYKMACCDVFIILDDAQYTKNSFINRNRIKTPQGELWLTIPVSPNLGTKICDVTVRHSDWPDKALKTLRANYGRARHFGDFIPEIEVIFRECPSRLAATNIALIRAIVRGLNLTCRMVFASELGVEGHGDQRLVELVKAVGGTMYLSGYGGRKYQTEASFSDRGLECRYYDFSPPTYRQLWGEFIPGLSAADALFNCGAEGTRALLRPKGETEG